MSKKLNVYYWKLKTNHGNFGDELNHYIISHLSGCSINQIIIPLSGFKYIHYSLRSFYHGEISNKEIPVIIKQFFMNDFIVGIGSIIRIPDSRSCKVWGSGIISKNDVIQPAVFFAVRGKYTQNRLRELNLSVPEAIGDPALLLPLLYESKMPKRFKLGVIPHFSHYKDFKQMFKEDDVIVIDLTEDIEIVIDQINSCEYTIATSLHGLIVSHAYKIKSIWYEYCEIPLSDDDVKFLDYFSSVNIPEYKPFNFALLKDTQTIDIINLIINREDINKINIDISVLQKQLIDVAPFPIKDQYILN
jgi:pyruvyltransferase